MRDFLSHQRVRFFSGLFQAFQVFSDSGVIGQNVLMAGISHQHVLSYNPDSETSALQAALDDAIRFIENQHTLNRGFS